MKALITTLALAMALITLPAEAQDPGMPDQVVKFFGDLAQLSSEGQCKQIGADLNAYLDSNGEVLNSAAYSVEEATPDQETAIMLSAKAIGTNTGKCFDTPEVKDFVDRFILMTAEISGQ